MVTEKYLRRKRTSLKEFLSNPGIAFFLGVLFSMACLTPFLIEGRTGVKADVYTCFYNSMDPQLIHIKGVFCYEGNWSNPCRFSDYSNKTATLILDKDHIERVNEANSRYPNGTKANWTSVLRWFIGLNGSSSQ